MQDQELEEQADELALDLGLEDISGLRFHPPWKPVGFPRKRLGVEDFSRRDADFSHEEAVACVCKTLQYAPRGARGLSERYSPAQFTDDSIRPAIEGVGSLDPAAKLDRHRKPGPNG
jgi:hypothetical protein